MRLYKCDRCGRVFDSIERSKLELTGCETQAFGALAEDMEIRRWILLAYPEAFGDPDEGESE